MSGRNIALVLLVAVLISFFAGCIASNSADSKNTPAENLEKPPGTLENTPNVYKDTASTAVRSKPSIVGGVAVGVSPRVVYADRGESVSLTVDLLSTENADDTVTININGTWINETLMQDIRAGASASVPVHITVPQNAENTSFKVKATSHNLNATSSTSGAVLIKKK